MKIAALSLTTALALGLALPASAEFRRVDNGASNYGHSSDKREHAKGQFHERKEQFQQGRQDNRKERRDERRDQMDANGDGKITEREFMAPFARKFREMDRNGDGVIDEADRMGGQGRHGEGGRMDEGKRRELMQRFDRDGDGKISEEERATARRMMMEQRGGNNAEGDRR